MVYYDISMKVKVTSSWFHELLSRELQGLLSTVKNFI